MLTRERRFGKPLSVVSTNVQQQQSLSHQVSNHPTKPPKRVNENSPPTDAAKRVKSAKVQPGKTNDVKGEPSTSKGDPTKVIESHVRRLDLDDKKSKSSPAQVLAVKLPSPGKRVTRSSSLKLAASKVAFNKTAIDPELIELRKKIDFGNPATYYKAPKGLPDDVVDFDKSQLGEIISEPHYAHDIFLYYKAKEAKYTIPKYMQNQTQINKNMRSVLIDWMVEVQESFELNHETLYLAVKLVDHYLSKKFVTKDKFQLLGATCLFAASKYDERIPPAIEDFLYICDDAYKRRDLILMEMDVLKKVNFFLGYPISYRFLRRYARCSNVTMETLTLARYILETSLMEYDLIFTKDSKMAAAALLLAFKMKNLPWV